jgi:CRISPR-associated exonuclease Cas4
MMDSDTDYLQLSGLQHFAFCPRQWALIHLEQQWSENLRTVEGKLLHNRAHDASLREHRGNTLILRELSVFSHQLGLSGKCDVMEFYKDENGITLNGEVGKWRPFPVEYKRGQPKEHNADKLQLCAQAMCMEEMLCCTIPSGALFYGETRHRLQVEFDENLRQEVITFSQEMHRLYQKGITPKVKPRKGCNACSLKEICLPKLARKKSVSAYVKQHIAQEEEP